LADKIRVGIVGATVTPGGSGWGANAHVPALQALHDYELKAVCTAHEETARASAEKFGAELAFHDMNEMVAHPDVDLIAVVVRVPLHQQLVMAAIEANKPVFCEWPLGAHLAEATEMADSAKAAGLPTLVGLQAQSDPTVMDARDLVANDEIGDVVTVNLSVMVGAITERGDGRIWQGIRANGANPMTIPGGHSIDALCYILGEFAEVSARVNAHRGVEARSNGGRLCRRCTRHRHRRGSAQKRRGSILPSGQRPLQREWHSDGDLWPQRDPGAELQVRQHRT